MLKACCNSFYNEINFIIYIQKRPLMEIPLPRNVFLIHVFRLNMTRSQKRLLIPASKCISLIVYLHCIIKPANTNVLLRTLWYSFSINTVLSKLRENNETCEKSIFVFHIF